MFSEDKYSREAAEAEAKHIFKVGYITGTIGIVFFFLSAMLVHFDAVRLYPLSSTPETLAGFTGRAEFTLRYQTLLVTWLMFNITAVIYSRLSQRAVNPLQPVTEHLVTGAKNILTNSMESFIVSAFSQLIFISYAEPTLILKYIPFVNIIQLIGRITFFFGYPKYRTFGYYQISLPNVCLSLCNLYFFGKFLEVY